MNNKSHTIFSRIPSIPSRKTDKNTEDKKVSYWLKKLFDQRAQKVINDKELTNKKSVLQSKEIEYHAPGLKTEGNLSGQKGRDDEAQAFSEENAKDKRLTEEMVRKSNREVLSIKTVFPWDLFPTTIRIQENKVSFIYHQLLTSQEQDVDIKDISNTHIDKSFLFARLKVISNTFANEPVIIDHLRKKDAVQARMIIQGLQLFNQQNINTSDYEIKELIQKLEELQTDKYNDGKK